MNRINRTVSRCIAALTLAAASCGAASVASAQERAPTGYEFVTVEFVYNPSESLEANYSHIRRAATRTCGAPITRPIALRQAARNCANSFIDQAIAQFGKQQLAEHHLAKTGRWALDPVQLAKSGR